MAVDQEELHPSHSGLPGVLGRLPAEVFEGGRAGRRWAVLALWLALAPVGVVYPPLVHSEGAGLIAGRVAWFAGVALYLWRRQYPTRIEWLILFAGMAAMWTISCYAIGPRHDAPYTMLMLGVPVIASVVFELRLALVASLFAVVAFTAVQLDVQSTLPALVAVGFQFALLLSLIGLVHGTALWLRRSLAGLRQRAEEVATLHVEMMRAADRERARIAEELHDDTIQVLTAATMQVDQVARNTPDGTSRANAQRALELLREAMDRARRLSFDLYPPQLDRGLAEAFETLRRQMEEGASFRVELVADGRRYPEETEQVAYRTVRELLQNARKHSEASRVELRLNGGADRLTCTVADDGRGFDPDAVRGQNGLNLGLRSIAERVRLAGGTFAIDSAPGEGTRVTFSLPADPQMAGSSAIR